jgi:hypothetical protein
MPAPPTRELRFAYVWLCRGADQAWLNVLHKPLSETLCSVAMGRGCVRKALRRHNAQNAVGISLLDAKFRGIRSWIAADAPCAAWGRWWRE